MFPQLLNSSRGSSSLPFFLQLKSTTPAEYKIKEISTIENYSKSNEKKCSVTYSDGGE